MLLAWPSTIQESDNILFHSWGKTFNGSPLSQSRDFQICWRWELDGDLCLSMVQEREERPVWMDDAAQLQWCSAGGPVTNSGHRHWHSYTAVLWCSAAAGASGRWGYSRDTSPVKQDPFFISLIQKTFWIRKVLLPQVCPCISRGASVTWHVNKFTEIPCQLGK